MTAPSMTTERENEAKPLADTLGEAVGNWRYSAEAIGIAVRQNWPEIEAALRRSLPPQPTGDVEGLEPLGINLVAVAHKERKNGNPELAAIIERAAAVIDQLRRANNQ